MPGAEEYFVFCFLFLAPYARTTRYEEAFFRWKTKDKKARFARAPHDYSRMWNGILKNAFAPDTRYYIFVT